MAEISAELLEGSGGFWEHGLRGHWTALAVDLLRELALRTVEAGRWAPGRHRREEQESEFHFGENLLGETECFVPIVRAESECECLVILFFTKVASQTEQ